MGYDRRQYFPQVSVAVQVFGLVDLTPTDVMAAFFLVAALQRANRAAVLRHVLADDEINREDSAINSCEILSL